MPNDSSIPSTQIYNNWYIVVLFVVDKKKKKLPSVKFVALGDCNSELVELVELVPIWMYGGAVRPNHIEIWKIGKTIFGYDF